MKARAESGREGQEDQEGIVTVIAESSALERSSITITTVLGIMALIAFLAAQAVGCHLLKNSQQEEAQQCGELAAILGRAGLSEAEKQRLCTMAFLKKCLKEKDFCADE